MANNIIEFQRITKSWGHVTALEGIDLDIRRGEILTLLGPSGCGKSTLLRIAAGFEQPTSGTVLIDDRDMTSTPPEKRPVNMVFQRYALFPHLDVFDNIAFGPRLKKLSKSEVNKQVQHALELVQLEDFKSRWIQEISGGQAQRVALARALVNHPSVLLLDEPLAALDLKIRHQMLDELKRIHRETGTTFLFVTHDQDEAMILSDRVVLMSHGNIEQIGTPDEIYGNPKTLFCAKFFGETNILEGNVTSADNSGALANTKIGNVLAEYAKASKGEDLYFSVRPEAIQIEAFSPHSTTPNQVNGAVEAVDFIGNRIVYKIRHASGQILKCQEPRGPQGLRFKEGADITLSWDARSVIVLAQ